MFFISDARCPVDNFYGPVCPQFLSFNNLTSESDSETGIRTPEVNFNVSTTSCVTPEAGNFAI